MKSTKTQVTVILIMIVISFAIGRYTTPGVKTEQTKQEVAVADKHTQVTTTTTKLPDGTVKTIKVKDVVAKSATTKQEKSVAQESKKSLLNVSAIVAYDFTQPGIPLYGISISKEVAGPITAGIFGLTNGILGVSIGINF